jgi:hypothetical protein
MDAGCVDPFRAQFFQRTAAYVEQIRLRPLKAV